MVFVKEACLPRARILQEKHEWKNTSKTRHGNDFRQSFT